MPAVLPNSVYDNFPHLVSKQGKFIIVNIK